MFSSTTSASRSLGRKKWIDVDQTRSVKMQNYQLALEQDIARNYKKAIEYYSNSVEAEELVIEAHLNLIVILIVVCYDYGMTSHLINRRIYNESQVASLHKYLDKVLTKSLMAFDSVELAFWKYYKENYYTGFSREIVKKFLESDTNNRIPYFQLYIMDLADKQGVPAYKAQMDELKEELTKSRTIKNEYILSLIESAEKQSNTNF